jgi:hypothetical protein
MSADRARHARAALVLLATLALSFNLYANELPSALREHLPSLKLHGSADMRQFGFKIYTARLWTDAQGYRVAAPYALDLEYALNIDADDLVETSIKEMRRQGQNDEALLARWQQAMAQVFPDVRKGDRLIGVAVPGVEARFYSARGYIASIRDADFVKAFFGIWLDNDTRAPRVRARLLGGGLPRL